MVLRKCLFEGICQTKGYPYDACPVNKHPDTYKTKFIGIDCAVWQYFHETEKERRVRYAQEKKH